MSLQGWLLYGDRGPIIGRWPVAKIVPADTLVTGDKIVIDNGMIRKARGHETGVALPEGSHIRPGGAIDVPEWWFWLHFRELLISDPPNHTQGEFDL